MEIHQALERADRETFTREPQNGAQLPPLLTTGPYSGDVKSYVRPGR